MLLSLPGNLLSERNMARSNLGASMEVVTVLLEKDSAALARISEMRQEDVEKGSLKSVRLKQNARPKPSEGLPARITFHYKPEPIRKIVVIEDEEEIA